MSNAANAIAETAETRRAVPAHISEWKRVYWSLRREFWENRAIYLAPLSVAVVFLVGFFISLVHLPAQLHAAGALDAVKQREALIEPYDIAAAFLMGTFLIIAVFYSIESLQRERRDRSILFWKSLPVSDTTTVLTKASIPLLVLPLLTVWVAVATQFIMLLASSAVAGASGMSVSNYWAQIGLLQASLLLLYHVMTVHVLWSAPVYSYLIMVSAWARRAALLWAFLPPLAIGVLEKLIFNTSYFSRFLEIFLTGSGTESETPLGHLPMTPMTHLTPVRFLGTPGLWIGLAVSAAFLTAAVRLRRYREPA